MGKYGIHLLALTVISSLTLLSGYSQPIADFKADTTQGCVPVVVSFNNLSTNSVSWFWDTGVGTSTLKNPGVFYTTAGSYTIRLIATASDGTKDTLEKVNYIVIHDKPVASFSADDTEVCTQVPVSFQDLSTAGLATITKWVWDFGDGNVGNVENPVHFYTDQGTYPVALTVSNQFGCSNNIIKPNYITAKAPDVSFSADEVLACGPPLDVQFTSTGNTTGNHFWEFGDGNTSTQVNPFHTYQIYGSMDVTHIVEDIDGCRDTLLAPSFINIGVNTLSISSNDSSICINDTIFFSTNAASNSVVSWEFGTGDTAAGHSPYYIYDSAGVFNATAHISDISGCTTTLSIPIEVFDYPTVDFTVADTTVSCNSPFTVDFIAQTSPGITNWVWTYEGGGKDTIPNPTHTFIGIDSFRVRLIVTGPGGCKTDKNVKDYIKITPTYPGFLGEPRGGCVPLDVQFYDTTHAVHTITNWHWDFGDGSISNLQHPLHTYTNTGYYDVTLVTTNALGCMDTAFFTDYVGVGGPPVLDFGIDTTEACALQEVQFINQSTGATSFVWYFSDGDTAMSVNPIHGFIGTGYMSAILIGTDRGCADTLRKDSIIYIFEPLPVIGISNRKVCELPADITFSNLSIGDDSWYWTINDTTIVYDPSFTQTFTEPGYHHIMITVYDSISGCEVSAQDSVFIHPIEAKFVVDTMTGCHPLTVRFSDSSTNAVKWNWNFGTGDSSSTKNPTFTYNDIGVYDVRLIVTNKLSCRDTLQMNSLINSLGVVAHFSSPNDSAGCVPLNASFTDLSTSTGTITQWIWDFGNGDSSLIQNPIYSYQGPGSFPVSLHVTDSDGCTDSLRKDNFIFATQPVPNFLVNPPANCPGLNNIFVSLSSGAGLTYAWNFGDGDQSFLANTAHAYAIPGSYDVSLTVTDVNGCDSTLTKPSMMTIADLVANFWADTTYAACPPLEVYFESDTSFPHLGVTWQWDFGDGATSNQPFPHHVYNTAGYYDVSLILKSQAGCSDTIVIDSMIHIEGPTSDFTFSPSSGCPGTEVNFIATSPDSVTFEWIFGDGVTGIGSVFDHSYHTPGIYYPALVVEDSTGCSVFTISQDPIIIHEPPQAEFTANTSVICDSGAITFFDQSTSANAINDWVWLFGDGDTGNVSIPVHAYTQLGDYDVTLIVSDQNGCRDTASYAEFIHVYPSPPVQMTLSDTAGCEPLAITFNANVGTHPFGITDWQWEYGDGNTDNGQATSTYTYPIDGLYTASLTVIDTNLCSTTISQNIEVFPLPNPTFIATDSFGCAPFQVGFSSSSKTNISNYMWDFGDGNQSTDSLPTHSYNSNGVFSVSLTVTDEKGCSETIEKTSYIHLAPPIAAFYVSDTVACIGSEIDFISESLSDTLIQLWSWDFGDGATSMVENPSHSYGSPGFYTISLTVTDVFGCSDQVVFTNHIEVLPNTAPQIISLESVSVRDHASIIINYEPYPNIDFGAYIINRETSPGNFTEVGRIENILQTTFVDQGLLAEKETYCYKIQVESICGIRNDLEDAVAHCSVNLTAEGFVDQVQLNWTPYTGWPDGVRTYEIYRVDDYNASNKALIATVPGSTTEYLDEEYFCYENYSYRVIAKNVQQFVAFSDTAQGISVHLPPAEASHVLQVTVEGNSFIQVQWEAAMIKNAIDVVIERKANSGGFKEAYRVPIDRQGGKYNDTQADVQYETYTYRAFTLDTCGDYTVLGRTGNNIVLQAEQVAGRTILDWEPYQGWENGVERYDIEVYSEALGQFEKIGTVQGNLTQYKDDQSLSEQDMNCFRVIAWESGGYSSTSLSNESCVVPEARLFSANAFTPNSDGFNDEFVIKGAFLSQFSLAIYNRWGKKVFETQTPNAGWNGMMNNGKAAPEGVYIYLANGEGPNGDKIKRTGSITLIR